MNTLNTWQTILNIHCTEDKSKMNDRTDCDNYKVVSGWFILVVIVRLQFGYYVFRFNFVLNNYL